MLDFSQCRSVEILDAEKVRSDKAKAEGKIHEMSAQAKGIAVGIFQITMMQLCPVVSDLKSRDGDMIRKAFDNMLRMVAPADRKGFMAGRDMFIADLEDLAKKYGLTPRG